MVDGKRSLFVDTSGWIEVFGKDNPSHKRARIILARAEKERRKIITTNYIITEFIGNGEKKCRLNRLGLLKAIENIAKWPSIEIVHISQESHDLAIAFLGERLDKKWSLVDATSFLLMKQRGILEALATDSDFVQAEFIKLL